MKKFDEFNLDKEILKSLNILNYNTPTEVQDKVIPKLIDKNNILVKSKTGTGKSASFAIPICNQIKSLEKDLKALVIVPTRELALQVKEEIENIYAYILENLHEEIAANKLMDKIEDEVLRLAQITGLAEMFADKDFNEAWECDLEEEELINEDE